MKQTTYKIIYRVLGYFIAFFFAIAPTLLGLAETRETLSYFSCGFYLLLTAIVDLPGRIFQKFTGRTISVVQMGSGIILSLSPFVLGFTGFNSRLFFSLSGIIIFCFGLLFYRLLLKIEK